MFDVFYSGTKPNLFAHEQAVDTIEQAQQQSRTRFFWFVNYLSDYTGFDFLWEPVPWQAHQRHTWPSQHQPDSGTYLVPKHGYTETNYHTDKVIHRLPNLEYWHIPENIDAASIDSRWSPDPCEPPFIYHFPSQWQGVSGATYTVPGATSIKLVSAFKVVALPTTVDNWYIPEYIDPTSVDRSWHPNPLSSGYIYHFPVEWGWDNIGGPEYCVPGATERKYVDCFVSRTRPDTTHFVINDNISSNDDILRWKPNPVEEPYIYVFGNQWYPAEIRESARYVAPGATTYKYIDEIQATRLPNIDNFIMLVEAEFDYSWEPDPGDPPYSYVFGNQHWPANIMPTV